MHNLPPSDKWHPQCYTFPHVLYNRHCPHRINGMPLKAREIQKAKNRKKREEEKKKTVKKYINTLASDGNNFIQQCIK